ncbi:MAG TPA: hypothetical protein VHT27_02955 [Solirubrobacteraceae bacterium]|jgi:hypothetical protein|nr:hypothetical protein [Solirubrobacteraceae bacterium]
MTKLVTAFSIVALGLAALAVVTPLMTRLASALVPLVLVGGLVAGVLRVVWAYTRRW